MPYTIIAITLIVVGFGLILWAYLDYRKRLRQRSQEEARSLVGVSLLGPIITAVAGLLTVGGGALVSNFSTIGYTINCASKVQPKELGFHSVTLDDRELRKSRTPGDPNVYKGEFTVLLYDDTPVVWVHARGPSNSMVTCSFTCDGKAVFKTEQVIKEVSPGTYSFRSNAVIP